MKVVVALAPCCCIKVKAKIWCTHRCGAAHWETHRSNNSSDGEHGEQPPPLFPGTSIPRAPTSQTGGMYPGTHNPLRQRGPGLFGPSASNIPMTGSNAIPLSGNIASTSNIGTASNVPTASTSNLNWTPDMMPLLGAKSNSLENMIQ